MVRGAFPNTLSNPCCMGHMSVKGTKKPGT